MTYEESSTLMTDMAFRGRVKVACLKFADSIFNEASNVAGHSSRLRWASRTFQTPDQVAMETQPPTVMDGAVQSAGAAISDEDLQRSVEAVVNKIL